MINQPRPLPLQIYRALSHVALPAVELLISRRVKRGKEDPARLGERRGRAAYARPGGMLVWLHAASVGEIATALPLIQRLADGGIFVLVTTVTTTSAKFVAGRLAPGCFHQFVPFDLPGAVNRFLDHWQPHLALFMEQELWPNLLAGCRERSIPAVLVNARMSPRSFKRWGMAPATARHLLGYFAAVLAQSAEDAERLSALGAMRTINAGNIKYDVPALSIATEHLAALKAGFKERPAWTAASTHRGEDEQILTAHMMARQVVGHKLALILAPRHPERGDEVAALCAARGLSLARRSLEEWPDDSTDVFLLDTIGELGLAFAAGALAFVGGSLVPGIGGHNPIEAAKLDRIVLHGPHVHNFTEVFRMMDAAGGGIKVEDASSLGAALAHLLQSKEECAKRAAHGLLAVEALGGAIDHVMAALAPFLVQSNLDAKL